MDGLRVLGVDPGLNLTGYGVLIVDQRRLRLAEAGVVRGASSTSQLGKRVRLIHEGIVDVIENCRPDVLALEDLFPIISVHAPPS